MKAKSINIMDLELRNDDKAFFYFFTVSSQQSRMNVTKSITDCHKLLRYSLHSKRFANLCKDPGLIPHWQNLLKQNSAPSKKSFSEIKLHPFDELLKRHCEQMSRLAKSENSKELSETFQNIANKFPEIELPLMVEILAPS
jgi:hypothetical protein